MEVHTTNVGVKTVQFKNQKQTRRVSPQNGKTKKQLQTKIKQEFPERVLNGIEASKLSDIEFKTMVIMKLNELTENYQKLQGSYNEITESYISMKKETETIKSQEELKTTISKLKKTVEGIQSTLDEAEDQIRELQDKIEKNSQKEQEKEKRLRE